MFEWLEIDWVNPHERYHSDVEHAFWFTHIFIPYEQAMDTFAARWGGFDDETLKRVLVQGEGDDRVAALWCLAFRNTPDAKTLLLPFLESLDPKERWSSAMCLGEMHEPEALPILLTMLTEFFPTPDSPRPLGDDAQWWFEEQRWRLPRLLRSWQDVSLVPVMREALEMQIESERYTPYDKQIFFIFQDCLAYEMGYRGALGVLTLSSLPAHRLRLALINMVIGFFDRQKHPERMHGITLSVERDFHAQFKSLLIDILEEQYGYPKRRANVLLNGYFDDLSLRNKQDIENYYIFFHNGGK